MNQVSASIPQTMAGKKGRGKWSVSQGDLDEQDVAFKLAFLESLDDPQVEVKLTRLLKAATKELTDGFTTLQQEIRTLRNEVAQKDAVIDELRGEVRHLQLQNDALEQ